MSAESRSHLDRGTQRRVLRTLVVVAIVLALVAIPLAINGELRFKLAHDIGAIPDAGVEQIAGKDTDQTLITLPIEQKDDQGRLRTRFRAAVLARVAPDGVEITYIDDGSIALLPIRAFEFWAGSSDGRYLLMRDGEDPATASSVLVDLATKTVTSLTGDAPYPQDIDGEWDRGAWEVSPGLCGGNSPGLMFIACYKRPTLAWFLAGDWELRVLQYGDATRSARLYRGLGYRPWLGWASDDARLYFQNEYGIFVIHVTEDMLSD